MSDLARLIDPMFPILLVGSWILAPAMIGLTGHGTIVCKLAWACFASGCGILSFVLVYTMPSWLPSLKNWIPTGPFGLVVPIVGGLLYTGGIVLPWVIHEAYRRRMP